MRNRKQLGLCKRFEAHQIKTGSLLELICEVDSATEWVHKKRKKKDNFLLKVKILLNSVKKNIESCGLDSLHFVGRIFFLNWLDFVVI